MCRFVILAVIATSLVSCVLSAENSSSSTTTTTTLTPPTSSTLKPNVTKCASTPEMIERRRLLMECLNSTVQHHLNSSATLLNKNCTNATGFGQMLDDYLTHFRKTCNVSNSYNTTYFMKLVEYSLSNNSFKTFYENITCLKSVEFNISNTCVRDRLGFFNITQTEKHIKWYRRGRLIYDQNTCGNSKHVKDCVTLKLQQCPHTTTDYVVSLFDYARNLENCSQYPDPALIPSPKGNGTAEASTWLTTPVISSLSVGAVVVIGAIITIVVMKNK